MKYRFIYKITCICGKWKGKFYIGQHTTENLDDGYLGSSVKLPEYWVKYGKELNVTYRYKILKFVDTQQQLDWWEIRYIGMYRNNPKCLNIHPGGTDRKVTKIAAHEIYSNEDGTYIHDYYINNEQDQDKNKDKENLIMHIDDIPIYNCGRKQYVKAIDLYKHGIKIYED